MPGFVTAGALRSRATIHRPIGTPSATGGVVEGTPELFADRVPVAITAAPLPEQLLAGSLTAGVTYVVRLRYLPGLLPLMTLTVEGRLWQITAVVDVEERHVEHQLACVEAA